MSSFRIESCSIAYQLDVRLNNFGIIHQLDEFFQKLRWHIPYFLIRHK